MSTIVETKSLSKVFRRQIAVQQVDLQVREGTIYGLLGPNGAGKTTILKLITGLLRPTSGEIRLFGEPWKRSHLAQVGALIETPSLYGHLTGRENLEVHRRLLGLPRSRIEEVLATVGLGDIAGKKRTSQYSLGMRQRLGIAIALLNHPRLLILDEPTNGLDPLGIRDMRTLIRSFAGQGITVILSSHILSEMAQIVDDVGIIAGGMLRYQGSLEALITSSAGKGLEELFMEYVQTPTRGKGR